MLVRRIQVNAFLKQLGEGMSEPAIILGDDNQRYILKNQKVLINGKSTQWDCMYLNELLSCHIANYLDVPIPEPAIANLDKRILDNGPALRFVHRFTEGIHFASQEIPDKEDNLIENYQFLIEMGKPYITRTWNQFFDGIINPEDISRIIAYDLLIANFDRYNNTGNLLVAQTPLGRKVFTIDHGHSFFGPTWDVAKITCLRNVDLTDKYINWYFGFFSQPIRQGFLNGMGEVFRSIESNIDLSDVNDHSFQEVVARIEKISEPMLDTWIQEIPDAWFVDKNAQVGLYKQFILKQKSMVRHLIQNMAARQAFTNFRGGNLQWTEKRAGTV